MKRYALCCVLFLLLIQPVAAQFDLDWSAQYFDNPHLSGEPEVERSERQLAFDWGESSPDDDIDDDDWSARFSKSGQLPAGTYRFIVTADDGFRLWVDNNLLIDTYYAPRAGATLGRDIDLDAGYHSVQIDFREGRGGAYLYLDWGLAQPAAPAASAPSTATGVVLANRLNIRSGPSTQNNIVGQVARNSRVNIIGQNDAQTWLQINANGQTGWVNASYVDISGTPSTTTTTAQAQPAQSDLNGLRLQANARLNIRSEDSTEGDIVGVLENNAIADILARNADVSWWKIIYNGRVGWVSAGAVTLSNDFDPLNVIIE